RGRPYVFNVLYDRDGLIEKFNIEGRSGPIPTTILRLIQLLLQQDKTERPISSASVVKGGVDCPNGKTITIGEIVGSGSCSHIIFGLSKGTMVPSIFVDDKRVFYYEGNTLDSLYTDESPEVQVLVYNAAGLSFFQITTRYEFNTRITFKVENNEGGPEQASIDAVANVVTQTN
ncbi:hypothetical protein KAR91_45920, partial [Candidatus Pacearchaeota archaeon]|nr:hypothetical protein [Candidatus Pacearchaeota archaeon]